MKEYIQYRREFHKYAEPSWREVRTSARIVEILTSMGVNQILAGEDVISIESVKPPVDLSEKVRKEAMARAIDEGAKEELVEDAQGYPGVIGIIRCHKPGPTFALRFDIDALPYSEVTEKGFRPSDEGFSSVHNCVHACGHDAHTAIGLGLAREIIDHQEDYCGTIKLIFQPAEETIFGAVSIVEKGHLDDVDIFIALHLAISAENEPLPSRTLAGGCKDFMSNRELEVTFHGKAAHPCGAAQEGKNALLAACTAALSLHSIAPHEKGLTRVNVGKINGGVCSNTIAPECTIDLEYRGTEQVISDYLEKRVFDILDGVSQMYDLTYSVVDHGKVPAGASDDELMAMIAEEGAKIPWFEKIYLEGNLGGTDDAATMMKRVQGHGGLATYIGIGTDTTEPLHNPKFDFDEDCMEPTIQLLSNMLKRKY